MAGGQPELASPALKSSLDLAALGEALDRKVKGYSMGMRQRLMLAQALMANPEVLILDEPANGLDPGEVTVLQSFWTSAKGEAASAASSSDRAGHVGQMTPSGSQPSAS
jgi:ABC-type multidrug transport system ATPase subunit